MPTPSHIATRIAAARDSFWTERPLVRRFQASTNTRTFSLKQLIEFTQAMPADDFARTQGEAP